MEIKDKDIDFIKTASHWDKVGNVYICNKCKYYTDKVEGKCPKCNRIMISVVKIEK